jgi:hypothetical protein
MRRGYLKRRRSGRRSRSRSYLEREDSRKSKRRRRYTVYIGLPRLEPEEMREMKYEIRAYGGKFAGRKNGKVWYRFSSTDRSKINEAVEMVTLDGEPGFVVVKGDKKFREVMSSKNLKKFESSSEKGVVIYGSSND